MLNEKEFAEKVLELAKENDLDFLMFVEDTIVWNVKRENRKPEQIKAIFMADEGIAYD